MHYKEIIQKIKCISVTIILKLHSIPFHLNILYRNALNHWKYFKFMTNWNENTKNQIMPEKFVLIMFWQVNECEWAWIQFSRFKDIERKMSHFHSHSLTHSLIHTCCVMAMTMWMKFFDLSIFKKFRSTINIEHTLLYKCISISVQYALYISVLILLEHKL